MEDLICDICHKKTKELNGFNYSEIKMCNKCYIVHLESKCENLRSYILNSFSEQDKEKFLKECLKGKLFDDVLKTFKPNVSISELEQELAKLKSKYEDCDKERLENRMEYLTMKNKWLNSEQQLAGLKEKAILPKFKLGQKVWYVYNKYQKFPFRCVIDKIVYDSSKNYKFRYDTSDELYIGVKEEDLFTTEQEAREKLKEMQGNE
mgnify:CR=1 FL=1